MRPHAYLRHLSGGLPVRRPAAFCAVEGGSVTIVEINAEPTPLAREGISDFLIQGKTGEVLPMLVAEVKKLQR